MITQHHGDNLAILPTLTPCSIQALITSPPYYNLRAYSIPPSAWPEVAYCPLIGLPPVVIPAMQCQLGAESDPLAYIGHLVHVFRLARPALRGDGSLWVNIADSMDEKQLLGIPHRAALALQADGWVWRSDVVWHKPSGMPESVRDRPTRAHEQILLFGVGPRYYYDAEAVAEDMQGDGRKRGRNDPASGTGRNDSGRVWQDVGTTRNRRSVWEIATSPMPTKLRGASDAHYAAWPPALVEIMVKASTCNKACSACGAAWVRQVERGESSWERRKQDGDPMRYGMVENAAPLGRSLSDPVDRAAGGFGKPAERRDLGFTPACACAAGVGRCVILDCFAGTGTTLAVAEALGRDSIGIDLGYQELQAKRTDNLQIAMEAFI